MTPCISTPLTSRPLGKRFADINKGRGDVLCLTVGSERYLSRKGAPGDIKAFGQRKRIPGELIIS